MRGRDDVTLAYAKPATDPLQDRAMTPNPVADFSGRTVENRTPSVLTVDFRGAAQGYAIGEAIEVVATFTEAVTVTGAPQVALDIGGATEQAVWKPGQAAGTMQVFVYTVAENDEDGAGVAIAAGALAAPPGSILTQTGNREVQLGHDAVAADPARVVDTVLPEATAAEAKGLTIEVTWSEALDETSAPAGTGGFTVRLDGSTGPAVTAVAVDGTDATKLLLTIGKRIADGTQNVTLAYTPPSSGTKIRDKAGNDAGSFTGLAVSVTPDTENPEVTGAGINGKVLTLKFDEPLDGNSIPAAPGGFRVTVTRGGDTFADRTVTAISFPLDGKVLELTLARAVASGDTVTLAYAPPSRDALQDRAATPNKLAGFTTGTDGVPAVDNRTDALELRLAASVTEGAGSVALTVEVSGGGRATAAREIAIAPVGTATADEGTDWTLGKAALSLPAGQKAVGTTVRIVNDHRLEDTETVTFQATADGVEIGRATLQIKDNDRAVLRVANAAAVEGDPLALVLRLDPGPNNAPGTYSGTDCFLDFDVTAELSAAGDRGALANPSALPSSHRFASDGTDCAREVTVELATRAPDRVWERPRTLAFTLAPVSNTDGRVEAGAAAAATVTDDTPPPGPTVQSIAVTGSPEGGDTWRLGETVEFEVRLDKAVTVVGKPELVLDIGGREQRASWKRKVGGTDVLRFAWTVARGDVDADGLRVTAIEADRNGTSVRDAGACTQNCVLVELLPPQSDRAGHKVDGGAYTVTVTLPAAAVEGKPDKPAKVAVTVLRAGLPEGHRFDDALTVILFIHEFVGPDIAGSRQRPLRTVYLEPGVDERSVTVELADDGEARADRRIRVRAAIGNPVDGRYAMETPYERFFPVADRNAVKPPVLSPQALTVTEGETQGRTYRVRLGHAPAGPVQLRILGAGAGLALTDANGNDLTEPGAGLAFTSQNWSAFQQVTVTAPGDDDAADRHVSLTHFVSEPGYVSEAATLAVTVLDDDTAALVLSKTELGVTEQGPGGSFTVALASAPTAPVTVTVASPAESGLTIAGDGAHLPFGQLGGRADGDGRGGRRRGRGRQGRDADADGRGRAGVCRARSAYGR